MTESEDPQYRAELITFTSKECYVYRPPPASSIGHRAEFWDVDHWLQVVEAVVDSSRYFAIRLVDRQSKRHAVIGIGFRERTDASDFNAALYEHTQYLRRKKEASEMREAYTASVEDSNGTASTSQTDMSLKPGETITLKLAKTQLSGPSSVGQVLPRLNSNSAKLLQIQMKQSSPGHVPLLAPPPAIGSATSTSQGQMSHTLSGNMGQSSSTQDHALPQLQNTNADEAVDELETTQGVVDNSETAVTSPQADATEQQVSKATSSAAPQANDWGDFVS